MFVVSHPLPPPAQRPACARAADNVSLPRVTFLSPLLAVYVDVLERTHSLTSLGLVLRLIIQQRPERLSCSCIIDPSAGNTGRRNNHNLIPGVVAAARATTAGAGCGFEVITNSAALLWLIIFIWKWRSFMLASIVLLHSELNKPCEQLCACASAICTGFWHCPDCDCCSSCPLTDKQILLGT